MATYIEQGVAQGASGEAEAVILTLNTPGGSLDATQRIVSALLEAPVPTIVWVAPSGGRRASAGTFITLSGHLAYMAPGTNIGAASPVGAGGEELTGTIGDKVKNDAIANIRSIAERGRNVDWAVSTVEKAVSSTASQAVAIGAVDGIARSLEDVRDQANGQTVDVRATPVTLELTDAAFVDVGMNPFQSIIHLLSDPNVAFILLTLGFYGLLFELQSPNFVTGILGAIALILAFIGFGSLPLNVAGLILIGLAVLLFVLETTVTSHGLLAVGGVGLLPAGRVHPVHGAGDPSRAGRRRGDATDRRDDCSDGGVRERGARDGRARPPSVARIRWRLRRGRTMTVPPGTVCVARPRSNRSASCTRLARRIACAKGETGIAPGQPVRVVGQEDPTLVVESGPAPAPEGHRRGSWNSPPSWQPPSSSSWWSSSRSRRSRSSTSTSACSCSPWAGPARPK